MHCPGTDVLAPGKAVVCTCLCHTAPGSHEGLERRAAEAMADIRKAERYENELGGGSDDGA